MEGWPDGAGEFDGDEGIRLLLVGVKLANGQGNAVLHGGWLETLG